MKTSGTFTFLFVTLMIISFISCSQLRQRRACTDAEVDRSNCDDKINSRGAFFCSSNSDCGDKKKCRYYRCT